MGIHPGRDVAGMTLDRACQLAQHIAQGNLYHVVQIVDMGSYRARGSLGWRDLIMRYRVLVEDTTTRERYYLESPEVWTPVERVLMPDY